MSWSGRVRAPGCGCSAANCWEGANSRQRIASTPAPPSHYPIRENSEENNTGNGRDPGRPEKATARPVARRSHAHPSAPARADSRGENLLALLAQLALRPDVPVERHGGDPEFAAERGHGGVAVVVSICAPSRLQRTHLSRSVLIVRGNASVTDQHCKKGIANHNWFCNTFSKRPSP